MAYDEGLAERIRTVLLDTPGTEEKKMFGGIAFMLRDYMFCGVVDDTLMARVGSDNQPQALTQPHVRPMDFTGRPMKGYVFVTPEGFDSDDQLAAWIRMMFAFNPQAKSSKKK